MNLVSVVDELKKGVETKIAAEFNTPLHMQNYITIGNTINTEYLEEEAPVGLTLEQVKNLLVMNGSRQDRANCIEKIVSEMVMAEIPSIIFDFSGKTSRLITYFKGSRFENNFLCFKLGSSFNINLTHSGIPYDKNNIGYLNYLFDAYAIAFKEDSRKAESFKNIILGNPDFDMSSISLDVQNANPWQKDYNADSVLSFAKNFAQSSVVFSGDSA